MIGFRQSLSCQDAMLRLKHDILTPTGSKDTQVVLGLDLRGAFNNIDHGSISRELNKINCGKKMYDYIREFLTNRTAIISLNVQTSSPITLGSYGTPQGSVLSPFLFNLAMRSISETLSQIPDAQYSLYADDITIWMKSGSDGYIQDTLQEAADAVATGAGLMNLECSPDKPELLLLSANKRDRPDIQINLGGKQVPVVDKIRVLGMYYVQSNRLNTYTLQTVTASVDNPTRLIGRVSNKHGGLCEADLLRLEQAFSTSKITFSLPYLQLTRPEEDKVNALIRKLYKFALGVPSTASTERLLATGTLNTFSELAEAHLTAQYQRLSNTYTGRHILNSLNIAPAPMTKEKFNIPYHIHENFDIPPLPKNMHPVHHEHRRRHRAKATSEKVLQLQGRALCRCRRVPVRKEIRDISC